MIDIWCDICDQLLNNPGWEDWMAYRWDKASHRMPFVGPRKFFILVCPYLYVLNCP